MSDRELRELIALITARLGDVVLQQAETAKVQREAAEERRELARERQETDRQIRELGKQIGGLGDKFGGFTEGLALPSMTKILTQRFGVTAISPRFMVRRNGRSLEIDVLAYSNGGRNEAFVVEVKSRLREDGLEQMRNILREFKELLPEHADKKVYGILAAVDIPPDIAAQVLREGIYLARIHDDQFQIQVPDGFEPRAH